MFPTLRRRKRGRHLQWTQFRPPVGVDSAPEFVVGAYLAYGDEELVFLGELESSRGRTLIVESVNCRSIAFFPQVIGEAASGFLSPHRTPAWRIHRSLV